MQQFENEPEGRGNDEEERLYSEYGEVLSALRHGTDFFKAEGGHFINALAAMQAGIFAGGPEGRNSMLAKLREYGEEMFPDKAESAAFRRGRLNLVFVPEAQRGEDGLLLIFSPVAPLRIMQHSTAEDGRINIADPSAPVFEVPVDTLLHFYRIPPSTPQ